MRRGASRAALALSALLVTEGASAYCRTTTCNPNDPKEDCRFGDDGCLVTGEPLFWRSSCVTVGVHELGSAKNRLSFDDVAAAVEQAFGSWLQADCAGAGRPGIDVQLLGPVECGVSEYNSKQANANIVLFREDDWPYVGAEHAIALTTSRFDKRTGELWDVDIELNGVGGDISVGDPVRGSDLLSVLTHEAGHFLGLSHSLDPEATMKALYDPVTDGVSFRSLAPDDIDGICAVYPPDRAPATTSCENRHGFSEQCAADQPPPEAEPQGCSVGRAGAATPGSRSGPSALPGAAALAAAAFAAWLARRRRVV